MKTLTMILFCTCAFSNFLSAQNEKQDLTRLILSKDSIFWAAYNTCDMKTMQQFIADDVEFYHDKGGITSGRENLATSIRNNLCGGENNRVKRAAVTESVKIFPLKNNEVLYGAIISGEHAFYVVESGKSERLDGRAKFTHVWILQNHDWKMSRILSYDHGPAPQTDNRKEINVAEGLLNKYAGRYLAPQSGMCNVKKGGNWLDLLIGDQKYVLYPFSNDHFFVKDRDLTFEFAKGEKGTISKMIVRENGNIVEEATRQKD